MKLSLNTDFTRLPRAGAIRRAGERGAVEPSGRVTLAHDERHLRRKVLMLETGDKVLVDLPEPVALESGDLLLLDDGRSVEVGAADEEVYDVRARDAVHLAELAWHIGNRHVAVEISTDRIVILRDHVIRAMLEGLGANVTESAGPFSPVLGAYSGHGDHHHGGRDHAHGHHHGEPDRHGRLPGDPHYGHDHA